MVSSNRSKRVQINKPPPQDGGSPAYRYHGQLGLLSGSSLDHSPVPLTRHENGHSDHIVHTSGGGRCGSMKKSRRKGRGKSKRAGSIVGAMVIRNKIKRSTGSRPRRRSTGSRPRRRRSYVRGVQKSPKRKTSYLASVFGF
tara:strand:+ start:1426 stop:1848 length:423 start_codon:yes stop_codon:yes gene_type:complete